MEVATAPCHCGPQPRVMLMSFSDYLNKKGLLDQSAPEKDAKCRHLEKSNEVLSETRYQVGISYLFVMVQVTGCMGEQMGGWIDGCMDGGW